jgi:hypothetical protein
MKLGGPVSRNECPQKPRYCCHDIDGCVGVIGAGQVHAADMEQGGIYDEP